MTQRGKLLLEMYIKLAILAFVLLSTNIIRKVGNTSLLKVDLENGVIRFVLINLLYI